MPQLPDVATIAEQGVPGFEAEAWWGMLAPAGVSASIVGRMNGEMAKVIRLPAVQERLVQMGITISAGPPEELGKFVAAEVTRWAKVVKDNNIKAGE